MTTKQGLFAGSPGLEARTWPEMLESTNAPGQVLAIARDYLATWDPFELDALSADCKPPGSFAAPEEIVNYAFVVVQYHCGPGAGDQQVARLANFFSHAARQVALLMSQAPSQAGNESS